MHKVIVKINDILYRALKILIMVLLPLMSVLVFSQVVARFTGVSMAWCEELSVYCFSWLSYFGAAVVLRRNEHIAVMTPVNAINNVMIQRGILIAGQVFVLVFVLSTSYLASTLVMRFHANEMTSINMEFLKMSYVYLQVPVTFFVFGLFTLEKILDLLRAKDPAAV